MSLVALHEINGQAYAISDLLISSPKEPSKKSFGPIINPKLDIDDVDHIYPVGLSQKFVILRNWLAIGWTNSLIQARTFISFLDRNLPNSIDSLNEVLQILSSYPNGDLNDLESVIVISHEGKIHYENINSTMFEFHDGTKCCLLGSGTPHYYKYYVDNITTEFSSFVIDPENQVPKLLTRMLLFVGAISHNQYQMGDGLDAHFGGGFEISILNPSGFRKHSNYALRHWECLPDEPACNFHGTAFVNFYSNDVLISVISDIYNDNYQIHLVQPPHKTNTADILLSGYFPIYYYIDYFTCRGYHNVRLMLDSLVDENKSLIYFGESGIRCLLDVKDITFEHMINLCNGKKWGELIG